MKQSRRDLGRILYMICFTRNFFRVLHHYDVYKKFKRSGENIYFNHSLIGIIVVKLNLRVTE